MSSVILIHGGVHGAWCWERVVGPLQSAGHDVQAVDLPGRGATADVAASVTLEDWVNEVSRVVDQAQAAPLLVAHSMGGVSAGQLAERRPGDIDGIVFLSALVPPDGAAGLPMLQEAGPDCALLADGAIVFAPDAKTATVAPDHARIAFYGRCSEGDGDAALARICPEAVAPLMTPVSFGTGFASVAKQYIGASEDRAVPPAFQRRMAEGCGAQFAEIDADHSPFFSATDELVAMLLARL